MNEKLEMSLILSTQKELAAQNLARSMELLEQDANVEMKTTWNWKDIVQNVLAAELVMGIFVVFWYLVTYYHYRSIMSWYHAPDIYIEITVEKMMQPELIGRALMVIVAGVIVSALLYLLYVGIGKYKRKKLRTPNRNRALRESLADFVVCLLAFFCFCY